MRIALILTVLTLSTGLFAQTSDSFLLQGTVTSSCSVSISDLGIAQSLDLVSAGHTAEKVADISSSTNGLAGMTLSIEADTNSELVNQSDASHTIAYSLDYSSSDTGTSTSGINPNTTAANLDSRANPGAINGELSVNITADASLAAGVYESNVTVTCATN